MPQTKEITIYTWDHCPYCQKALALLNAKGLNYQQVRIDGDETARDEMSKVIGAASAFFSFFKI